MLGVSVIEATLPRLYAGANPHSLRRGFAIAQTFISMGTIRWAMAS